MPQKDVDVKDTGNVDPESVRLKITDKTKAIIVVHWAGQPVDLQRINQMRSINILLKKLRVKNIFIVEELIVVKILVI